MRILIFLTLLSIASIAVPTTAQEQSLQSEAWRLTTGDSAVYASPDYDDSKWKSVAVPAAWETLFPNYDGFGWYRVKFTLSKTLATEDTLVLLLGKIDDLDETFLNGQRIGATGKISPPDSTGISKWTEERAYFIPKRLWRETNTLSVRVLDTGGGGGLYEGDLKLIPKKSFVVETFNPDVPHRSLKFLPLIGGNAVMLYDLKKRKFTAAYPKLYKAENETTQVKSLLQSLDFKVTVKPNETYQEFNPKQSYAEKQRLKKERGMFVMSQVPAEISYGSFGLGVRRDSLNARYSLEENRGHLQLDAGFQILSEHKWLPIELDLTNTSITDTTKVSIALRDAIPIICDMTVYPALFRREQVEKWVMRGEKGVMQQAEMAQLQVEHLQKAQIQSNKQLLASLPPGEWNIAWVRDGCYAIVAAAKHRYDAKGKTINGYQTEPFWRDSYDRIAKGGLEFFLTAQANRYKKFVWKDGIDYGVGKDYQISVCRYYGNGTEESDANDSGPNIELDGFGLSLWAMQAYIEESGDTDFLQRHWTTCKEKIADVILHCIVRGKNSPLGVAGLIRKDSGIWERHLPGKQYTNTSVACFQGLKAAAWLAEKMNDRKLAKRYSEEAEKLRQSILKLCVDDEQVLKGNAGARDKKEYEYYDASVVEAINFGVLRLDHPAERAIAVATLKKFDDVLKMKTFTPDSPREGWARCSVEKEGSGWYDEQEWVFLDLRIASAYIRLGDKASRARAKRILDWVTAQTAENFGLIAELYTVKEANYAGAYPMIGFGAGAYLLTLMDYYK